MKEHKHELIYSEPVTEIMGRPPSRLVRSGTLVMFLLFIVFIFFMWIIRYPDVIPSPVEITTTNPPVTLVSKITGHIQHLLVADGDSVRSGQLIGVMETTASVKEIDTLKAILDTMSAAGSMLPEFTRLGELQEDFAAYRKNHRDLMTYDLNDLYGSKVEATKREISALKEYIIKLSEKEMLFNENNRIEERKYKRDEELFKEKFIAESNLEEARQSLIRNNIELQQVRLDMAARKIELAEKEQQLADYSIRKVEDRERLVSTLEQSLLNLRAQTDIWINTYYLESPVDGIATFTRYWSVNQSVEKDEPVVSIIPIEPGEFVGRVNLRMQRSGKVKEHQLVNIKLSGFPYLEYGMVRGIVRSKSLVPSGDAYIIEIKFPDGLKTLYGRNIEFTQNMQGIAEIITDDLRLIQKIVYPVRHMIEKNKKAIGYFPE